MPVAGTLAEKLAAIAAAELNGVGIFEPTLLTFDGGPREVGAMVRDHGMTVTPFKPFSDFEALPEPLRALARAERKFGLMEGLGTDLVLACSSAHPASLGGIDRATADLHELGELAAGFGSATRRWPGSATSRTPVTLGRWCGARATRPWA